MAGSSFDEPAAASLGARVRQFYSRQIKAIAASAIAFVILSTFESPALLSIPREGFATLAGMFATLAGLTFAAFSVLTALMPSVPKGFLRSRTFLMFGQTFVLTMWIQLFTVLGSGLCYLAFGNEWIPDAGVVVVFGAILSVAFLLVVVHYMLFLFKVVRKQLVGEGAPNAVL